MQIIPYRKKTLMQIIDHTLQHLLSKDGERKMECCSLNSDSRVYTTLTYVLSLTNKILSQLHDSLHFHVFSKK